MLIDAVFICRRSGAEDKSYPLVWLFPQVLGVLPVLLGLGYRHSSVEPLLIPYLAKKVIICDTSEARELGAAVCAKADPESVRRLWGLLCGRLGLWAPGPLG